MKRKALCHSIDAALYRPEYARDRHELAAWQAIYKYVMAYRVAYSETWLPEDAKRVSGQTMSVECFA